MRAVFVTATDTGVGKTFVSYNLALTLREMGVKVGYFKPIETDVRDVPSDGAMMCSVTGQEVEEAVPVRFRLPLSPYAALLEEGGDFSLEELYQHMQSLLKKYEFLIVEGAGGIAVPIKKGYDYARLAKEWNLPVLLVARAGLGTINHTYLSWFYMKTQGINLLGIIMNGFSGKDVSERTNPQIVEELTGIKPLCLPYTEGGELPPHLRRSLAGLIGF